MPITPQQSLRRTAFALGAIPLILIPTLLITGRFSVWEDPLSLAEAWNRGLVQGFIVLNVALLPISVGVLKARVWARWAALLWFPALAANNLIIDLWELGTVRGDTMFQGALIGAIWLWAMYRRLFASDVSLLF